MDVPEVLRYPQAPSALWLVQQSQAEHHISDHMSRKGQFNRTFMCISARNFVLPDSLGEPLRCFSIFVSVNCDFCERRGAEGRKKRFKIVYLMHQRIVLLPLSSVCHV